MVKNRPNNKWFRHSFWNVHKLVWSGKSFVTLLFLWVTKCYELGEVGYRVVHTCVLVSLNVLVVCVRLLVSMFYDVMVAVCVCACLITVMPQCHRVPPTHTHSSLSFLMAFQRHNLQLHLYYIWLKLHLKCRELVGTYCKSATFG